MDTNFLDRTELIAICFWDGEDTLDKIKLTDFF